MLIFKLKKLSELRLDKVTIIINYSAIGLHPVPYLLPKCYSSYSVIVKSRDIPLNLAKAFSSEQWEEVASVINEQLALLSPDQLKFITAKVKKYEEI